MSKMFDSKVYDRRHHTPWAVVSLTRFIEHAIWQLRGDDDPLDHEVVLRCRHRPDVASRKWYTLEWTDAEGNRAEVSSQRYDLLLWRACQREADAKQRAEGVEPAFVPDLILAAINAEDEASRLEMLMDMAKRFDVALEDSESGQSEADPG